MTLLTVKEIRKVNSGHDKVLQIIMGQLAELTKEK